MAYPTDGKLKFRITNAGNDANGGGYYDGGAGTDKSTSAPVIRTDLVLGAGGTTVTSAGTPFDATDVNNIINIVSGTGFTAGRYRVASVAAGVATLSSSAGTGGSTGGTGRLGGQMLTIGLCAAALTAMGAEGALVWLNGTQTISSDTNNVAGGRATFPQGCQIRGYHAVEGDEVLSSTMLPVINRTTATNVTQTISFSGAFANLISVVRGIRFTASTTVRVWSAGAVPIVSDCWFEGQEWVGGSTGNFTNCRWVISGLTSFVSAGTQVSDSVIVTNLLDLTGTITNCLIVSNTAIAGNDQYRVLNASRCTIVAPGTVYTTALNKAVTFNRCLLYSTNAAGSVAGHVDYPSNIKMIGCAYNAAPTNVINAGGILYSGDPFVNRAGGNYALSGPMSVLIAGSLALPGLDTTTQPRIIGAVATAGGRPMIGGQIGAMQL